MIKHNIIISSSKTTHQTKYQINRKICKNKKMVINGTRKKQKIKFEKL